jgi:hypothetical protein
MTLNQCLTEIKNIVEEWTNGLTSDEECANKIFLIVLESVNTVQSEISKEI